MGIKLTKQHTQYWSDRKIDWRTSYFDTWNHPHRSLIAYMLSSLPFYSLWEIGVGGGANLAKLINVFKNRPLQMGGCDVSKDAIDFCIKTFPGGVFHHESADNMMMSDKSIDVLLSDMTLIYVDPFQIDTYLKEIKRVTRNYIVFCEFHHPSWWKRAKARLGGYHVYNYQKLLKKHGFYDIMVQKIPAEYWPGTDNNQQFRYIITACTP